MIDVLVYSAKIVGVVFLLARALLAVSPTVWPLAWITLATGLFLLS